MKFTHVEGVEKRTCVDLLILPFWHKDTQAIPAASFHTLENTFKLALDSGDFLGKEKDLVCVYPHNEDAKEKRILLLGLGEKEHCSLEILRRAYGRATKYAVRKKCTSMGIILPGQEHGLEAICEGIGLASYTFDAFKQEKAVKIAHVEWIGKEKDVASRSQRTLAVIQAVCKARDLVNGNADDVTPSRLVQEALDLARLHSSITTTILDKKTIEKEHMGLILAVNRGSAADPALAFLEYQGDPDSNRRIAIVGKGITYDTGGLNLKPTGSMETMKCDMAGAAVVLSVIQAAATLGLKVNLIGALVATENAIGPHSYKPGDVYKSYTGKTVEISNTDAEGRLVLADTLAYLVKTFKPDHIIDLATLTGGIVIALGEETAGLFSNNDHLAEKLIEASMRSGERIWRLPLYPEYKQLLCSSIADIKNSGGRKATSITAALFLEEFVGKTPWAHLDIAGSAYLSELGPYYPTHATGFGVRLLVDFLQSNQSGKL